MTFTPRSLAAMAYLSIAGSLVAYSAYIYAIQHLPLSTVSLYAYINPMIAVALGTALLGEPLSRGSCSRRRWCWLGRGLSGGNESARYVGSRVSGSSRGSALAANVENA